MESLGLDVKLLLAQVVNFTILLVVLSKLLYKPLIKMIDERNKKISDSLENSKKIEEMLKQIEEKEVKAMEGAREKAKSEKESIIALAQSEREEILNSAREQAKRELEKGLEAIKAAEGETVKKLTDDFMNDLVKKLQVKMTTDAKSNKHPKTKKLIW